ncbi:phytoene desaturase family protein [Flavihumibacter fluvii]|uniref:phytoene desaturase family protein n=1 Tax=Flavihumibacter fluvii TaxID=2838157 RepID=UPI001BDE0A15|nr:NAD(P)/FAD-dependent oxidoreductase [Flavihumibacter fluvii]ULQ54163.1 NAD(P)/FAD-dependent oxidoreductase [Flavihumibacter fluvii]
MQKPERKDVYDVVVIGSGVGGLTAAALLSKSGLSVCVLEKEPHPGGYLAGFRRKDFLFDTAIHWLNQYGPDGMVTRLFDVLGNDHPAAIPQQRIRRYLGKGYDYLLTNNPDLMRDQLIADFPHEKEGLMRFFSTAKRIGNSLKNFNSIFRSGETMHFFERWLNKIGLFRFIIPFIPYVMYSGEKGLKKGLHKFFRDQKLVDVFTGEHELIGCFVPIGWAYFGDFQNPPKGGSQVIPQWLEHVIRYYSNSIFYQSRVTEILVKDKCCKGVRYEYKGRKYEVKSKYVIAANDIETLYEKMLPKEAIPVKLKQRLKTAELYSSSVTISIALDCATEALGFNEEMIHLADEGLPYTDYAGGDPEKSEIIILAPTVRDKTMAAEGKGTLTIFMPATMDFEKGWRTTRDREGNYVRGEEYKKLKHAIAEAIIKRVDERVSPGLRSHILFYEVATPVTHYRYTGNKNGTMMGARPGRANMQNNIAHYQTPVKNLILGGHWAELGGGVPIAAKAGANAALLVLKKENKDAFTALAAYMDGKQTLESTLSAPCFKHYDNSWVQPMSPAEKYSQKAI